MKLGIIVIYLVNEQDEKLLDIHLDQISKNATSEYTIYANVNMLIPKFVNKLKNNKNVKICNSVIYNGPVDGLRATYELSFYAEQLIAESIKDGVSHVVMMHPDSFPVKVGWENNLANNLSDTNVMISKFPEMSSCLFFHRDFYKKYNPSLIPKKNEMKSSEYNKFLKEIGAIDLLEPGMGYAFEIYKHKLKWKTLKRTNNGENHYFFGSVFGDLIFHLGATSHDDRAFYYNKEKKRIPHIRKLIGNILHPVIKQKIITSIFQSLIQPEIKTHQYWHSIVKGELYSDPEGYIEFLRKGQKR